MSGHTEEVGMSEHTEEVGMDTFAESDASTAWCNDQMYGENLDVVEDACEHWGRALGKHYTSLDKGDHQESTRSGTQYTHRYSQQELTNMSDDEFATHAEIAKHAAPGHAVPGRDDDQGRRWSKSWEEGGEEHNAKELVQEALRRRAVELLEQAKSEVVDDFKLTETQSMFNDLEDPKGSSNSQSTDNTLAGLARLNAQISKRLSEVKTQHMLVSTLNSIESVNLTNDNTQHRILLESQEQQKEAEILFLMNLKGVLHNERPSLALTEHLDVEEIGAEFDLLYEMEAQVAEVESSFDTAIANVNGYEVPYTKMGVLTKQVFQDLGVEKGPKGDYELDFESPEFYKNRGPLNYGAHALITDELAWEDTKQMLGLIFGGVSVAAFVAGLAVTGGSLAAVVAAGAGTAASSGSLVLAINEIGEINDLLSVATVDSRQQLMSGEEQLSAERAEFDAWLGAVIAAADLGLGSVGFWKALRGLPRPANPAIQRLLAMTDFVDEIMGKPQIEGLIAMSDYAETGLGLDKSFATYDALGVARGLMQDNEQALVEAGYSLSSDDTKRRAEKYVHECKKAGTELSLEGLLKWLRETAPSL